MLGAASGAVAGRVGITPAAGLVGPGGGAESKLAIAEIGIVLLLFLVGLELKQQRLWRLKRDIFALGFLQLALFGAELAAIIYFSSSFTWGAAIALGLQLSMSSTEIGTASCRGRVCSQVWIPVVA